MGTGAFVFKEYVPGSHVIGARNPDYFIEGHPYLDGFRALSMKDQAPQVAAIRGGRALVNFRALPPKTVDDLRRAMGDDLDRVKGGNAPLESLGPRDQRDLGAAKDDCVYIRG